MPGYDITDVSQRPAARLGYMFCSYGVLHNEKSMCLLEDRPGNVRYFEGPDWYEVRWRNFYSIGWKIEVWS
jgi:hypothetical protein